MPARTSRLPAPDVLEGAYRTDPVVLIAGERSSLSTALADALATAGWRVRHEEPGDGAEPDVVLWPAPEQPTGWDQASSALTDALLLAGRVQEPLERVAESGRAAFVTVTRMDGRLGMSGAENMPKAVLGGAVGLVSTLAIEAPALFCRSLDLAPELSEERCAELVVAELHDARSDLVKSGYSADGTRWTVEAAYEDGSADGSAAPEPGPDDLLVVTGGGRGVTAACTVGLAERYGCGALLLGRTKLADEPSWTEGVSDDELKAAIADHLRAEGRTPTPREVGGLHGELVAQREIRRTLASIRESGAFAEYLPVDTTDAAATAEALAAYRDRITGVVHGAGVLADQLITAKQEAEVARVLAPKLAGLRSVLGAVDQDRLRHLKLFSSVAGFFGNRGQSDYGMANAALNSLACAFKREHPDASVTAVNWGAWDGGMVTPGLAKMFAERGVELIPLQTGVDVFAEQFRPEHSGDVVCVVGPGKPLSEPEPPRWDGEVRLRRDLGPLTDDPVIADHVIGGAPVLPAAVAIGGLLDAARQVRPDVRALEEFQVLSGVVFDGSVQALHVAVGADVTASDDTGKPRYRATARTDLPSAEPLRDLPPATAGEPLDPYSDGTLFHGPALRGIERLLADGDRLVLGCRLRAAGIADGAYEVAGYRPEQADLLLQAVLVWVRRHLGRPSLPTAVGRVEPHAPLPDGEPFHVVVDEARAAEGLVRATATACDQAGGVLLRFRDVDAVVSTALESKFTSSERGS
ncbi:KR domain-containing protein [Saccharopolyspora erythraea]|uniref:KR domain-containing protein n=1 Tax=Saccharopolyspora erythraea TaxID=1836 RepID=UPI001BA920BE|nr:KR domain-containing protein [Saccharopolyspora erythraea]QUG99414.1 KR domain-containing protein [Saccharopolyspora erythraea]